MKGQLRRGRNCSLATTGKLFGKPENRYQNFFSTFLLMFVLQQCSTFVSCGDNSQASIYKGISKIITDTVDVRSATIN